jgi:hypothetical protein
MLTEADREFLIALVDPIVQALNEIATEDRV